MLSGTFIGLGARVGIANVRRVALRDRGGTLATVQLSAVNASGIGTGVLLITVLRPV